ncbi:MAG: hypothetical protein AB1846_14525 [Chloroflexota bacterium]
MKQTLPMLEETPSIKAHKRQAFWQITLPLAVTALLILAVAVLAGISAFGDKTGSERWAAISTIWLVVPVMFIAVVFLVVLAALIYGLARLLKIIPPYSGKAQYHANHIAGKVRTVADTAVKPIMLGEGLIASLKALFGKK